MEPVKNLKRFVAVLIILILPAAFLFAYFRNYAPNAAHESGGGTEHHAIEGKPGAKEHDAMKDQALSGGQQPMQPVAPQPAGDAHGDPENLPLADGRTHEHEGDQKEKNTPNTSFRMFEIIPNWHPILVHFTVALLNVSVGFFILAWVWNRHRWRDQWLHAAHWNLWVGAGFSLITVMAGWIAFNSVAHDPPSHAAMTIHRNWGLTSLAWILPFTLWSIGRYRTGKEPNKTFIVVALIMLGLLASTGWRGGELVYRYGLGVMSLPKSEGKGHGHGSVEAPLQNGTESMVLPEHSDSD